MSNIAQPLLVILLLEEILHRREHMGQYAVTRTPATSFQCCFLKLFPAGAGFQSFNLIALATNFPYQIFPTNVKTPSAFGGAVFFFNVFSINRMLLRHLQRSLNWRKFVRNLNVFGGAKKKEVPQGWKWKMEKWWDNTWEELWCCTRRPKQESVLTAKSSKQIALHLSTHCSCTLGILLPLLIR